ncbi:MAG: hypothetical protein ACRDP6_42200 [Actinoallomurus sp.]
MMRDPRSGAQRIIPAHKSGAYQTYSVSSPRDTTVKAACEQVGCAAWMYGWETPVDESTELGRQQAAYIRTQSGRTFREMPRAGEDSLTVFRFESGQRCFANHQTRPESYAVLAGDWRMSGGVLRRHTRGADFVEDFGLHQQRIADQQKEG